jgi:hypothetical protein
MRKKGNPEFECLWQICGGIMFLPYAVRDNIERKKTELNVTPFPQRVNNDKKYI